MQSMRNRIRQEVEDWKAKCEAKKREKMISGECLNSRQRRTLERAFRFGKITAGDCPIDATITQKYAHLLAYVE